MSEVGKALELAQEVMQKPDRYPAELQQAAAMVLVEPHSAEAAVLFMEMYNNSSKLLSLFGDKDLGWPPAVDEYYLPSELNAAGIELGQETLDGWTVKLFAHRNRHLVVTGMTGSGKTTILLHLAEQVPGLNRISPHPCAVLAFDRHRNFVGLAQQGYRVLCAAELRLPIFYPFTPGLVRGVNMLISELRGLVKSRNLIAEAQTRIQPALPDEVAPTLTHVIQGLRSLSFPDTKKQYLLSALTELKDIRSSMGRTWDWAFSDMIVKLTQPGQLTVVDTGELDLTEERLLLGWILLYCIGTGHLTRRDHDILVIIDEAQALFQKEWTAGNTLRTLRSEVLTARQPRVRLWMGSQMPDGLEPEVLASATFLICTGLRDGANIKATAGAMGIPHTWAFDLFQSLAINEAIFSDGDRARPFRIEVPRARTGSTCNERRCQREVRRFQTSCDIRPGPPWKDIYQIICRQPREEDLPHKRSLDLLRQAAETYLNPLPLKKLAARAGMGAPEASRRAGWLEKNGYLNSQKLSIGRRRVLLLEATPKGFDFVGYTAPRGGGRGGPAHRYLVSLVDADFQGKGFQTRREVEIGGKRIDLLATRSGDRTFVEVQITAQNAGRNAAADLQVAGSNTDKILFVSPTKTVLQRVGRAVEGAVGQPQRKRFQFSTVSNL